MCKFIFSLLAWTFFWSQSVYALEQTYPFDDVNKSKVFDELTQELRCPKCQNQNIADSNAMVAIDLKNKTYELVKEGNSKQQVVDFMVARYGNFVHYDPPINSVTIWLWVIPVMILVLLIVVMLRRKKEAGPKIDDNYLAQAEALLAQAEQKNTKATKQDKEA
ncbi:cytochrome c-type biogenesis protein [Catenovulum adriaticum]|uniref:Cytochrome c-type biogenesis protein n=1 Tax=Catenovulum adriaticum TaxID=2984846 RepID=A0ABY7AIB8_9ALTE|nr:cytochrome c-type biogenesis protein [Catenovulum sp. TS8]WAJ69254.1 cytochrome c-type biogenesis protein CcmH [Catenovulum sp. TS8]